MTGESAPDPRYAKRRHNRCGLGDPDTCGHPDCPDMDCTAQPTTDPADAWDPAFCRTCGWLDCECPGAARQRPTQQAATDRAAVEAVEARPMPTRGADHGGWRD